MQLPDRSRLAWWAFGFVLALQTLLILNIPMQAWQTRTQGQTVLLQTAPVDPYSLFHGYYTTLNYEISQQSTLSSLPGWEQIETADRDYRDSWFKPSPGFYVTLERPAADRQPWQPVAISPERPNDLAENQIALRGLKRDRWLYGLERFYMPEDRRDEINQRIWQAQGNAEANTYLVEVKIDARGNAVPTALWLEGEAFRF